MRLRRPIQTRFRYGFPTRVNLATYRNSQAHSSKGTRSLHVSPQADPLPRLVGTRFQVLFHDPSPGHFSPFPHGTCSLSVTREYLGLGGGPPRFTRDFSGPVLLGCRPGVAKVSPTGVSPSMPTFSNVFGYLSDFLLPAGSAAPAGRSRYPERATPAGYDTRSVWPVPLSLTTTQGIAVAFSSCGY
jgi:hypothetical protein